MIDLGWLGVLYVNRNIALATAVDLTARCGDVHTVWHATVFELLDELIHHRLDHP